MKPTKRKSKKLEKLEKLAASKGVTVDKLLTDERAKHLQELARIKKEMA